MKQKQIKKMTVFMLVMAIIVTMLPYNTVAVYAETATLTNLGQLGTVIIGDKKESGTWYKTYVDGEAVFCLNLGKACHSGDTFTKQKQSKISSASNDEKESLKARIGYWYYVTEKESDKAWIVAQCLIWGVEEDVISKTGIIEIIGQIKEKAGYSKAADKLYEDIFDISRTVECEIITWTSTATSRQKLIEIKSGEKIQIQPKYKKLNEEAWYRQRITISKMTGDAQQGDASWTANVKFKLTVLNYKEMYSYSVKGLGDEEWGTTDGDGFEIVTQTDENGRIVYRFTYRIQSKDYYYYEDEDLEGLTKDEIKGLKEELDKKGYRYADDLSEQEARFLIWDDLEEEKNRVRNKYIIEEIDTGNGNILLSPVYEPDSNAEGTSDAITSISGNKAEITLNTCWWKGEQWDDEAADGNYILAYKPLVINKWKKVKLTVEKKDYDNKTAQPQGDASIDGAIYGLYQDARCTAPAFVYSEKGEVKEAATYTVKDGNFQTDYLKCGEEYYLKEISPGKGYLLDTQVHKIVKEGDLYTEEFNIEKEPITTSWENVIKGKISLKKIMTNGSAGIAKPEPGAQFQVYLASSGSFDNCKETERELIITDNDGYAQTKELPYGTYIVHQIKGNDNNEMSPDFEVDVMENGKTYTYVLNNPELSSYLRIVKKDKQTGKTVLKEGTTYQIYSIDDDGNENIVKQKWNNGHEFIIIDRFTSDNSGRIVTYEEIPVGKYRIYEIDSASGMYNEGKPLDIEIANDSYKIEQDSEGNTIRIAEVEYFNDETYGKLTVAKTGEVLKEYSNNTKKFIYEQSYLSGTEFEIYAGEDIFTQDNQKTKWFEKGEKVAVLITGKGAEFNNACNGICTYKVEDKTGAVTVTLPLGKYQIKESKTNYGYIIKDSDVWDVEFKWNNQSEEYVWDSLGTVNKEGMLIVNNERAKAKVHVIKKDGKTGEAVEGVEFGIYCYDDIYSEKGELITKANTLLGIARTDKDGYAAFDIDIPLMSQQYKKDNQNSIDEKTNLNSGDYYVVESKVPDSYYINQTRTDIHIEYKDSKTPVIESEIIHTNSPTELVISKLALIGSKELKGCRLLIKDKNDQVIVSWITSDSGSIKITDKTKELGYANLNAVIDENGRIVINGLLQKTEYTLIETKPADGYTTAESITFMLKEKDDRIGETEVYIKNDDGQYYENEGNKIIMRDDTTKIEFKKLASDTNKLLKGAKYKVYDSKGRKVYTFTTSQKETTKIEGKLNIGEIYTFVEIKAPKGYKKAEDIKITIKDTGEIQTITVIDKKINLEPKSPKTGDYRNIIIYWWMLVGSFIIMIVMIGIKQKAKELENINRI